jgi:tetratricopeptide (TPR) repeat protein
MSRVALLVGVSRYSIGLDPLPSAQKDIEVMKRVLKQPRFRFDSVQSLCDRPLQEMQETIERFFKQRHADDQLIFLFCGYLWSGADGLYFATPSTQLDEQGAIVKAQTLPASAVKEAMDKSPAKQQVFILDGYSRAELESSTGAEPAPDLESQLGGAGRVLLAASTSNYPPLTQAALDVWTYPRYLAEGIESGAADTNDDGMLTAADLHHYAAQKLQVAAPALKPAMYGSAETAQMPLLEVPNNDPRTHYRKVLETAPIALDASGAPMLEGLPLLKDIQQSLGVSPQEADALTAQVLRPTQEYYQRAALYQEQVAEQARSQDANSLHTRQTLKQWQQALHLNDWDVAMLTIAPTLIGQQRHQVQYQDHLAQYQQVLLWAMQRQYPLRESDRTLLQRLRQTLQLGDDDVTTLEAQITAQAEQFVASNSDGKPEETVADVPDANTANETHTVSPVPQAFSPESASPESASPEADPPPSAPSPSGDRSEPSLTVPTDDSRAKEVVLQRLFSMNGADASALTPTSDPPLKPVPEREEPFPILPNARSSPMDRVRRSASNYQALIIPALLLAAIIGLIVAILPSVNRSNWFKFGQASADPAAAQRLNLEGQRKAQAGYNKEAIDDYNQAIQKNPADVAAYTNRGISYHQLGDTGAAIRDYEQALKLDPKSAVLHSNLSYAYYDRKNYDKALEAGNQAVALNGSLAQAHINLANARSKKGDYTGALQDYGQAIALRPPAPVLAGAHNNRGNAQLALNQARAALNDYNVALSLQPEYADAYYNLGLAQQSLGNRPAAIRHLQTAATLYQRQGKEALQKEATDRVSALQKDNNVQSLSTSPSASTQWR